ncbi:MAG TPA: lactate racemase domain-containing protein, partial [Planctomycetota bacterium]
MKKVKLQYGTSGLELSIDAPQVTVVEPRFVPGLPDEAAAFRDAVRSPIGTKPLKELVKATDRVAVVIPDITR